MRRGGRTRPKPRRMARGGAARGRRPAPRKMARGGRAHGRKMPGGGMACGGMNQPPCAGPGGGGGYRRGGRTRPVSGGRRMAHGGKMSRGGVRKLQAGGSLPFHACPAGFMLAADGTCLPEFY